MKFSLATPLISRDGSLTRDAKLLNCYWESTIDGDKMVIRRPPLYTEAPLVQIPVAQGQAMYSSGGVDYLIAGDRVYGVGGWNGLPSQALPGVTTPNQRMSVVNGTLFSAGADYTIVKSASAMWRMQGSAINQITTAPASVPGIVYLDGSYYVMNPEGMIYGSAIEDPTSWNALNFISTDRGLGRAVALARHLNYVVAFCEKGLQFFYNAGNPAPGSPLSPVANATTTIGCAHSDSIQELDDTTIFMSADLSGGRSIKQIRGLTVGPLSDSNVDRVLQANKVEPNYAEMYSLMAKMGGHTFYVLTLNNLTLACDLDLQSWSQFSTASLSLPDLGENAWDPGFALRPRTGTDLYFLARKSGKTYSIRTGQLGNELVRVLIRTKIFNSDNSSRKRISELNLFADTVSGTITCRYSNDDAQTWSVARPINLALPLKRLTRLGSFYNRNFEFNYIGANPLQITSVQVPDRNAPAQVAPSSE